MEFNENEKAVIDHIEGMIAKYTKGWVSQEKLDEAIKAATANLPSDLTPDRFKELTEAIEKQGLTLKALQEQGHKEEPQTIFKQMCDQLMGKTKAELKRGINLTLDLSLAFKQVGTVVVGSQYYLPFPTLDTSGWGIAPVNPPIIRTAGADAMTIATATAVYVDMGAREGTAGSSNENAVKNQIDFTPAATAVDATKFTAFIKFSDEAMDDIPGFLLETEKEIVAQLYKAEDSAFITYIASTASAYDETTILTSTPNTYDAIVAAIAQVQKNNFVPNAVILNNIDFANMMLAKDGDKAYMVIPQTGDFKIGNVPVYVSPQITAGYVLVGDMSKFHIRDFKGLQVAIGYDGNDFTYNLTTIRAEKRSAFYIKPSEVHAFVYDAISDIVTAVTS